MKVRRRQQSEKDARNFVADTWCFHRITKGGRRQRSFVSIKYKFFYLPFLRIWKQFASRLRCCLYALNVILVFRDRQQRPEEKIRTTLVHHILPLLAGSIKHTYWLYTALWRGRKTSPRIRCVETWKIANNLTSITEGKWAEKGR